MYLRCRGRSVVAEAIPPPAVMLPWIQLLLFWGLWNSLHFLQQEHNLYRARSGLTAWLHPATFACCNTGKAGACENGTSVKKRAWIMNANRQQVTVYVWGWTSELLKSQAETSHLLAAICMGWLYISVMPGLNKIGPSWILQLIKRNKTQPPNRRLLCSWASAQRLSRLGKWGGGLYSRRQSWC